jgi:hypothetical protein
MYDCLNEAVDSHGCNREVTGICGPESIYALLYGNIMKFDAFVNHLDQQRCCGGDVAVVNQSTSKLTGRPELGVHR